jgi:hypothetical protein
MAEFKRKVGKIKFVRATTKTDIKKDKVIPALPSGKRYPKRGTTTNKYGTFKNNTKRPYWENRANRMDVNQPSKSVYPKLAKGGKFNDDLYFDQLASMSGARAVAVKEWASANNLSKDDLLNIIQGLGMKQITPSDFVSAVLGNKSATSEIVSYAKSGKGFKMAKGGMTEHGLQVGDKIVMDVQKRVGNMPNTIGVEDYDKEFHLVDLDKGERYAKGGTTKRIKRMGC